MPHPRQVTDTGYYRSLCWNWLYKVAGMAALITAVLIVVQMIVFILRPPPSTAIEALRPVPGQCASGIPGARSPVCHRECPPDTNPTLPVCCPPKDQRTVHDHRCSLWLRRDCRPFCIQPGRQYALPLAGNTRLRAQMAQRSLPRGRGGDAGCIQRHGLPCVSDPRIRCPGDISIVMLRINSSTKYRIYGDTGQHTRAWSLRAKDRDLHPIFSVVFLLRWYILITLNLFQLGQGIRWQDATFSRRHTGYLLQPRGSPLSCSGRARAARGCREIGGMRRFAIHSRHALPK